MKALVRYQAGKGEPPYLAVRLRKNVKGALESTDAQLVDSLDASPSIVHLISPEDGPFLEKAREYGAKVVVSALYAEGEPSASYLGDKEEDGFRPVKPRALRMLRHADAVFVPGLKEKGVLVDSGIPSSKIEILSPGVNVSRFEGLDPVERDVFRQYFNIRDGEKVAVVFGDYENGKIFKTLEEIASNLLSFRLIFIGYEKHRAFMSSRRRRISRRGPKNMRFEAILEDDVFRSLLRSASFALFMGEAPRILALEAMASKTPIFLYKDPGYGTQFRPGENAILAETPPALIKAVESRLAGDYDSLVERAYRLARAESLLDLGKRLLMRYRQIAGEE